MVGNYGENIFVEFDYNNISIVDPNRIIDENGVVRARHIKQENLVMYANLECKVIPRTKLVFGASYTNVEQLSLASINFLKQQDKQFLDNSYTDEFTGQSTLEGKGTNQVNYSTVPPVDLKKSKLPDDYFIQKSINTGGKPGSINNGLLGIKSINMRMGMSFVPTIDVVLEDVKGRALFELGDNSPYAAFFNLPYPKFILTLKGWMGKAVKYNLMLQTFKANFDGGTGNFIINLKFLPYKYTILSEISVGAAIALPHMYQSNVTTTSNDNTNTQTKQISTSTTSLGVQKLKEVYSEYKSKGLMDDNTSELTLMELRANIDRFSTNILNQFTQQNLTPLSELKKYSNTLNTFYAEVFGGDAKTAWQKIYTDEKNFFVLQNKTKIYVLKEEFSQPDKESEAISKLRQLVNTYTTTLKNNPVLGLGGTYDIQSSSKQTKNSAIPQVEIFSTEMFFVDIPDITKAVDIKETARQRLNTKGEPTKPEIDKVTNELSALQLKNIKITLNATTGKNEVKNRNLFFVFNSPDGATSVSNDVKLTNKTFVSLYGDIVLEVKKKKELIENDLTEALGEFLRKTGSENLGFVPTLRNTLGIFYANTEAFLRILDDVHFSAWEQRNNRDRQSAILDPQTKSANTDFIEGGDTPIYPWPSFVVTSPDENGQEKYSFKYPGDKDYVKKTKANDFTIWPEVEFVEEFAKALTQTTEEVSSQPNIQNQESDIKRVGLNPIEFPISNQVYQNKEETKFFYEIWERLYLVSNYSKISRAVDTEDYKKIIKTIVDTEFNNLTTSLGDGSPFLTQKIKNIQISANNFSQILFQFSNQGQGPSYQNFIRGEYNTPYIRNILENSKTRFIEFRALNEPKSIPQTSMDFSPIKNYITSSTTSDDFDFTDLQPFTSSDWIKQNLSNGKNLRSLKSAFNTKNILTFIENNKIIANFSNSNTTNRPVTNFNFENGQQNVPSVQNLSELETFYETRELKDQLVTEGNLNYFSYSGNLTSQQTTSMLNTPYFVNAIQNGVQNAKTGSTYPYLAAAYLFLNSLPIATTKETFKTLKDQKQESTGYIFASFKKFAAIHKIPYAFILKLGSVWYRYKTYVQSNVDILDSCWKNFDYVKNFDPDNGNVNKTYQLNENGVNYDIVLERDVNFGEDSYSSINLGFYPKLINDFNYFLRGEELFTGYTSADIQSKVSSTTIVTGPTTTETTIKGGFNFYLSDEISKSKGNDPNNPNRSFAINSWSCSLYDVTEDVKYILPSVGTTFSQIRGECFERGKLTQEISGNTSMYNGSVRLFWSAPQFGYFDSQKVSKPNYDEYIKFIDVNSENQENFSINGQDVSYSKIDDLFGVFDTQTLDLFANEFLGFCKTENNLTLISTDPTTSQTTNQDDISFGYTNFQILMKNLLAVRNVLGTTTPLLIKSFQEISLKNISSILKSFLTFDKLILIGNPSNFDRKIFTSFSHKFIIDGTKWDFYNELTPNALPSKNNSITLETSKVNYPNEWIELELQVGFSTIEQLRYKNGSEGGSYITDFFIDFNVAFTIENIKKFSTIIKIYATQKLNQFSKNPTAPTPIPKSKQFILMSSTLFGGSMVNIYRTNGQKIALISDPSGKVVYTSPKRIEITPQELTTESIQTFYGGQSQLYPVLTSALTQDYQYTDNPITGNFEVIELFKTSMDTFLNIGEKLFNDITNQLFQDLNKSLPNTQTTTEQKIKSVIQGEQPKYDYYETFKAINDKWIAGNDFKITTLFEDVLILDRASKNIGDKVIVDIFKLKKYLTKPNTSSNMLTMIRSIIMDNNFVIMDLPSYVNFYNVQDVVKNPVPKNEGTLEFGNTLFGTYTSVDYRKTSAKMVCFYGGKASEHLASPNNNTARYKDDTFNMRRASDNPLVENLTGKKDWGLSNKVVAFNVDIGPQEQSIFYNMEVGMNAGQATAESLQVNYEMRNQGSGTQSASQSVGLYNLYKTRSYTCSLSMIGNALIQPTMYFNLRHIPMFAGPYMIQSVNHSISQGRFDTRIEGIRQPAASLPLPTDYLQSLKQNLLTKIEDAIKQIFEVNQLTSNNNKTKTSETATKVLDKILNPVSSSCSSKAYPKYKQVEDALASPQQINAVDALRKIKDRVSIKGLNAVNTSKLNQLIFGSLYLTSVNQSKTGFEANYNNFAAIDLENDWGQVGKTFFSKNESFICLKTANGSLKPYATFDNFDNCVNFLIARWFDKLSDLPLASDGYITKEKLIEFWVKYNGTDSKEGKKQYNQLSSTEKGNMEQKAELALKKYKSLPE